MSFKIWLENDLALANAAPASGEVIRTGLQPQVGSHEIHTDQKAGHDKMMALDGHIQRVQQVGDSIQRGTPQLDDIKAFCKKVAHEWELLKTGVKPDIHDKDGLGSYSPNPRQVNFMKDNQPLPEAPRATGPGTFGGM